VCATPVVVAAGVVSINTSLLSVRLRLYTRCVCIHNLTVVKCCSGDVLRQLQVQLQIQVVAVSCVCNDTTLLPTVIRAHYSALAAQYAHNAEALLDAQTLSAAASVAMTAGRMAMIALAIISNSSDTSS
jgi:hypothetical protein